MQMFGLQAAVQAFVLILVVGVLGCSTESDTAPLSQEQAIAEIKKLGGRFEVDQKNPHKPVVSVHLLGPKVTDAGLEHLKALTNLQMLDLPNTQVTDTGLEHLKGLTKLFYLNLTRTQVTGPGLEHLKGLSKLEWLYLDNTQITDAGLEHLKGLTKLFSLELNNTQVTDEGVKKLQQALPNCKIHH